MKMPKLFKFTKAGKVQEWQICAEMNEDGTAYYEVEYGLVDGKKQKARVDVTEGKNLGKKNATTPYKQACNEAISKWDSQLDKGYSENAPKKLEVTAPMLAKPYDKEAAKVTFPCYWQPKLDGIRCIAQKEGGAVKLLSRRGKSLDNLPHIQEVLEDIMPNDTVFDGELYTHGIRFQTLISWVKRAQEKTPNVQYNVYDIVSESAFSERFKKLCDLVGKNGRGKVRTVHTDMTKSHQEISSILDAQIARGYEGIMLRVNPCVYKIGRRSSHLLKVKKFIDKEFVIIGAEENKGRQKGQCTFICRTDEGATFKVKPMGTNEERREMWTRKDELIGKLLTVRFFEWTSSKPPVPRFPVGVTIRDYE